jgi:zinc finger CCHC domain-containing protein 9
MTRYTKLEKRKLDYVKDKTQAESSSDRSSSPESVASTSAVPLEGVAPTKANRRSSAEDDEPASADEDTSAVNTAKIAKKTEISEPSKLLKRIKLLRLKAKKSKDITRKNAYNRQIQDMERRINVLNGERGVKKQEKKFFEKAIASGVNPWKAMEAERRNVSDVKSAHRRDKREEERMAATRCFACRQMGHSANKCTNTLTSANTVVAKESVKKEEPLVCCYRCGSTEHNLAKCTKPAPEYGSDLPFASCFICGKKGHISSKCNLNQGRGIYPNGGCCLLCQSVDHLAKDCHLRAKTSAVNTISNAAISLGEANGKTGADEDDFHSLSRKKHVIEQQEKAPDIKKRKVSKKVVSF